MPMGFGGPRHERSNGFGRFQPPPPREPREPRERRERMGIGHGVRFFGPIRFRLFGMPVYISSGRSIGFFAGIFAIFIMAISIFGLFSGYKNCKEERAIYQTYIAERVEEKTYYQQKVTGLDAEFTRFVDIIQKAKLYEDDNYYIASGTFYNNYNSLINGNNSYSFDNRIYKYNKYYEIVFTINPYDIDDSENVPDEVKNILIGDVGESSKLFSTYLMWDSFSLEKALGGYDVYIEGNSYDVLSFEVALAYIDGEVYAINTDLNKQKAIDGETSYYNSLISEIDLDIQDCEAELLVVKSNLKTKKVGIGILFGIIALIVLVIVLSIVKVIKRAIKKQKIEDAKAEAEIQEAQARVQEAQARADIVQGERDRKNRYCEYCGAQVSEDDNKCPNCGSIMFQVKK